MRQLGLYLQQNYCWPEGTGSDEILATDARPEGAEPAEALQFAPVTTTWTVHFLKDVSIAHGCVHNLIYIGCISDSSSKKWQRLWHLPYFLHPTTSTGLQTQCVESSIGV